MHLRLAIDRVVQLIVVLWCGLYINICFCLHTKFLFMVVDILISSTFKITPLNSDNYLTWFKRFFVEKEMQKTTQENYFIIISFCSKLR